MLLVERDITTVFRSIDIPYYADIIVKPLVLFIDALNLEIPKLNHFQNSAQI